ncbi:MAG: pyridoxal 5'-phosphate synthase glutaminase subunit PdxT [Patescibacteria group bacterium]
MDSFAVGVLALQGDVSEHVAALEEAARRLKRRVHVKEVRSDHELEGIGALVIPGGESTTLQKLCEREGMLKKLRTVPNIFGTCAGAIFLAKSIRHAVAGQKTLALMDIEADRNAYGRQTASFEVDITTAFGPIRAVFIRAPRIRTAGKGVKVLAWRDGEILACEQKTKDHYYLATAFHPELTTTTFHEHFLTRALKPLAPVKKHATLLGTTE